jgi:hypothetical protein
MKDKKIAHNLIPYDHEKDNDIEHPVTNAALMLPLGNIPGKNPPGLHR